MSGCEAKNRTKTEIQSKDLDLKLPAIIARQSVGPPHHTNPQPFASVRAERNAIRSKLV